MTAKSRTRSRSRLGDLAAVAIGVAVLALPFGVAIAAGASAGNGARNPAPGPWAPEPLPPLTGAARSLADGLDDLPIRSDALAAQLEAATILDPHAAARAFDEAWESIPVEPGHGDALERLRQDVALGGAISHAPTTDETWFSLVDDALGPLARDRSNAERLNDAAVALFLLGMTGEPAGNQPGLAGWPADRSWTPEFAAVGAIRLLQAVDRTFPRERAVMLNLALMRSVVPDLNVDWSAALEPARAAVERDPSDVTARVLLASLESRRADVAGGGERAAAILEPLLGDPATGALGHAATGDALLAEALIRAAEAPATTQALSRRALAAYDAALADVADAGVYAGRATALEALGFVDEAVAAQERAVELAPESVDLLIGLAGIHEARGDADAEHAAANRAIDVVLDGEWDPPMRRLRFVTGPGGYRVLGDRGFLGWSVGRQRDHVALQVLPQGGGFVVIEPTPPRISAETSHYRTTALAPFAAWDLAMTALIARGDADEAAALEAAWYRDVPIGADWQASVLAARIVETGAIPGLSFESETVGSAVQAAAASLRALGYDRKASALCESLRGAGLPAAVDWWSVSECAAAGALRAGDAARALSLVRATAELAEAGAGPQLWLLAGAAAERAGEVEQAAEAYRTAIAEPFAGAAVDPAGATARTLAVVRLGDLALTRGDPIAALENYELASVATRAVSPTVDTYWEDASPSMSARALDQVLRNNRAVARLQTLQASPGEPPRCEGEDRAACEAAGADVAAAIASDPGRAAYHLNAGWVARLLGDSATARSSLATAVKLDRSLFPALNDLGILMARGGDHAGAREAFRAAIGVAPDYVLARWNLGVLGTRAGGLDAVHGQHSLASAIELDPSLRHASISFRHDEQTYRFSFDPGVQSVPGQPVGRSYGIAAMVLGAAATAAALVQLQSTVSGKVIDAASEEGKRQMSRMSRRLQLTRRRRGWRRRLGPVGPALPWLLTAPVLTILTTASAVGANPEAAGGWAAIALIAVATAVAAHALGHVVAARVLGAQVIPAQWLPGVAMSLVLAPVQIATGPFLAERARTTAMRRGAAWWIHAAGPLANGVYAILAYVAWVVEPMPAFRLIVLTQLAAISYSLLPIRPLDGEAIGRSRPGLLVVAGIVLTTVSAALALNVL